MFSIASPTMFLPISSHSRAWQAAGANEGSREWKVEEVARDLVEGGGGCLLEVSLVTFSPLSPLLRLFTSFSSSLHLKIGKKDADYTMGI